MRQTKMKNAFKVTLSDGSFAVVVALNAGNARRIVEGSLRDEQADGQFDRGVDVVRVESERSR